MTPADTVQAYRERPIGSYLAGPTYAVWWKSMRLNGIVFWDRPDEGHVQRITDALEAQVDGGEPHASLIDARRVRAVDLGAFTTLSKYVLHRSVDISRVVARQAVVRPDGLTGAVVAGFYSILSPSHSVDVFTEPVAALEWLGIDTPVRVAEELEALYTAAMCASSLVIALRAYLDRALSSTNISKAAAALGLSSRQLQRQLRDARTCFQQEQSAAKIRAAKALLLETNYDVKRVALEVGFTSPEHFCVLFRKEVSETPSEWRSRARVIFARSPSM